MKLKKIIGVLAAAGIAAPGIAFATNGMNMEGYGPIATGMGGASMAYDNGIAAVMNNPATIGLMAQGNRVDLAVGGLHPDVTTNIMGMSAPSGGDAYYMPAAGWAQKNGKLAYGFGVFAQGGMGTEYGTTSALSMGSGLGNRSEVGVGRAIVPLAYDVDPKLTVAGSIDFVWAGMDLQMLVNGGQFMGMAMGDPAAGGTVGGSMMTAFNGAVAMGMMNPNNPVNYGHFDFSNSNDYSGKATATGWAGKLGVTYKVNNQLTLGATYHSETDLGDLEGSATVRFNANLDTGIMSGGAPNGVYMAGTIPVTGKIAVRNFQWPETYGVGMAYQATDRIMVAADYKRINWSKVMKNFQMTFTADGSASNGNFANTQLDATMYQNWDDQDVFQIGVSFKTTDALTLRAGANLANNPIPNNTVNPLFPATVKNHYTVGAGYAVSKAADVNFSYSYAPKVTVNSPATVYSPGYSIDHAQNNWQLMYSHRF